jgi:PAS domain S-box-containing protein
VVELRKTGIDVIGDVPWGTHFCQFYQTKQDLIDILVPYFKAGLESNEFCMWVTAEPLKEQEIEEELRKAVPDFNHYLERRQIEILPHDKSYFRDGAFNPDRVLNGWVDKLNQALAKGYDGLRLGGNTFRLGKGDRENFVDYEVAVNDVIRNSRMLAICSYCSDRCDAAELVDVVINHQFSVVRREGEWEIIGSGQRKRMEEELQRLGEQYQIMLHTTVDGFWVVDTRGRFLEVNDAYCRLTGYSRQELLSMSVPDVEALERPEDTAKHIQRVIQTGADRFETRHRCKDGRVLDLEVSVNYSSSDGGRMYCFFHDVTERKKAEESLRKVRDELEVLVQERTEALREANKLLQSEIADRKRAQAEMRVRAKQQAVVAQLGQLALAGASLDQLFHEAVKQIAQTIKVEYCKVLELLPEGNELLLRAGVGWKEGLVGLATVGAGTDSQAGYTLLSNKPVIVEDLRTDKRFSGPPLLHEHGVVSGMSVVILGQDKPFGVLGSHTTRRRKFTRNDIYFLQAVANVLAGTIKRKNVEEKFRSASLYNRSLIEASLDPLVTIDVLGRITDVNAATELATGFHRDDLIGKDFSDYFTEPEKARSGYQQVFRDGLVYDYALEIRRRDGHVTPVLYNASVYRDENGKILGVFAAARDITEKRRAEEAVKAERQRFNDALDTLPAYLVLLTPDYHVPFANRFFREHFGESHGKRCFEYLFGRTEPCEICETYKVLKTMKPLDWEWTGPDGRNYYVHDFPFTDSDGSTLIMEVGIDITEQKRAEAALRKAHDELEMRVQERTKELKISEERYRNIVETAGEGIWTIDAEAKITFVNGSMADMLGYTVDGIVGKSALDFIDQKERAQALARLEDRKRGLSDKYDLKFRRKDGTDLWTTVSAAPIPYAEGRPFGSLGMFLDITERKHAEEAMQQGQQDLNRAQAVASIGSWRLDVQHNELLWSDETYRMFGIPKGTPLTYETFLSTVHPEDRDLVDRTWTSALKGGPYDIDHRIVVGTEVKWVREKAELEVDERGVVKGGFGTVQDITERKQAEEVLRETRDYLENLIDYANAPIIVWDPEFRITRFNHAFERLTGYAADEVLGKALDILFPKDSREESLSHIRDAVAGQRWEAVEIPILRQDGTVRIVLWNSATLYDQDGKTPVATIAQGQDITERKQAEEALQYMTSELARSNAELEQFAYVASHDLQEPLRMVSSYVQLIADRYKGKLDQDADDFIRYAHDGALRMQRLIHDLLAYSRIGTRGGTFEQVNLEAVLAQALSNLELTVKEHNAIVTCDPLPVIWGDAVQLAQLFQNLIDNAIKFRGEEAPRIHVSIGLRGSEWVLSVRDNGIGIAPEYFDRIFLLFQRLHPRQKYPGTGLGLAICKRIVDRHGGRIWVESKSDEGSTFCFSIPSTVPRREK